MTNPARTRFAPSPTGFLHVGGVRTALFNYLYAKNTGGKFLLRLEDTDRERFVEEGVEQIVEALGWLGLIPDDGFWIQDGTQKNIEYIQSERHKNGLYHQHADRLLQEDLAYYSYISNDDYQACKDTAQQNKAPFVYRKQYEAEYHTDAKKPAGDDKQYPIRLDIEAIRTKYPELAVNGIGWHDEQRGEFTTDLRNIEDFIIIKSDGFPTYNFANVLDDHDMTITHILRGDEFIASTGKHALLYKLFDWDTPVFVHLPVINGTDGKKLSKRTGDTNALDYRSKGYMPEALLNFLALLGWNAGTEQEFFTLEELEKTFSLERIGVAPAVLDPKRLDWISGAHIRKLPVNDLYERVRNFWPAEATKASEDYKKLVLGLVQERLKYFAELPELTLFFFKNLPVNPELWQNHKQLKKLSTEELKDLLEQSKVNLEQSDFSANDLTTRLNHLLEQTTQKPVVLFSLIRIATTQAPASPGLADTLAVLGKNRSLQRIDSMLESL